MTKQKQLIEYHIQDIIEYMVRDYQMEYDQAMYIFYHSLKSLQILRLVCILKALLMFMASFRMREILIA